jgi:RNA polymerase sigma-70 factor (sigma-E family)
MFTARGAAEFEAFAVAEVDGLLKFARTLTTSPQDAEDLVQEALLQAYSKWTLVRDARSRTAYVRRIMVNMHLARARTQKDRSRLQGVPLRDVPDGSEATTQVEWHLTLAQAIRNLPTTQRTVISLKYYAHLETSEIAEWMNTAESSVRANLSRAIAALRREMDLDRTIR